ncbi:Amino acid permease-associated region [Planctomycetales bacterium 10988]|nr:Amino acid permease-associated region [Planctomycetales bacterium 10988]
MVKKFGFWTLTFLVIANMIGAGVFTTSGFSLLDLGSPEVVLMAWLVGGGIAVAGAYSYGMLVKAMPESGGEYLFLSRAAHPLLGFIAGWVSLIAGFSGAIAFAATAFESYSIPEEIRPPWLPVGAVAIASIVLAGAFHGLSTQTGAFAQNAVVLLKLGLLAAILLFALAKLPTDVWQGLEASPESPSGWALATAFAGSLVWISLSYSGFNAAVYVAGEVNNAEKIVPRALVAGTGLVVFLYLLLNAIFVYAPPAKAIQGQPDVAAIAARALGGEGFEVFVRGTIALCLLTSVFSMMMAAPRVYAKMAEDGFLPSQLRLQDGRPLMATIIQVALATFLVLNSTLEKLLSYLGLTLSISAACSVFCLFLPTIRKKTILHLSHLVPAIYILATLLAAGMMISFDPWQMVGTLVTFSVGAIVYLFMSMLKTAPNPANAEISKSVSQEDRVSE